jgi:recombination protein RecR
MNIPRSIQQFITVFSGLPSIGPRQATRLAFYLIAKGPHGVKAFADAVSGLSSLAPCPECFFVAERGACPFCGDKSRRKDSVAIVERPTDVLAIEKTRAFNGVYLVLGDLPKNGAFSPDQAAKIARLKARGSVHEIIFAFDQTTHADFGASLLARELAGAAAKITKLGRGIPTGGEIEFADEETLGSAFNRRS